MPLETGRVAGAEPNRNRDRPPIGGWTPPRPLVAMANVAGLRQSRVLRHSQHEHARCRGGKAIPARPGLSPSCLRRARAAALAARYEAPSAVSSCTAVRPAAPLARSSGLRPAAPCSHAELKRPGDSWAVSHVRHDRKGRSRQTRAKPRPIRPSSPNIGILVSDQIQQTPCDKWPWLSQVYRRKTDRMTVHTVVRVGAAPSFRVK